MKKNIFIILFIFSVVGVFAGIFLHLKWFDYIFKPFIMISIAGYFFINAHGINKSIFILMTTAFLFSLFGDIFMMLTDKGVNFFLLGLSSFLLAQVIYIYVFLKSVKLEKGKGFLVRNYALLILYIIFGGTIYYLLFPNIDYVLKVAIFVYIIAISSMSAMALNRYKVVRFKSFILVFLGSVLFMISDTIIALNTFYEPIPFDRVYTMSTYISAQYLIMIGILFQFNNKQLKQNQAFA